MHSSVLSPSRMKRRDGEEASGSFMFPPAGSRCGSSTLEFPDSPSDGIPSYSENAPPQGASDISGGEEVLRDDGKASGKTSTRTEFSAQQAAAKSNKRRRGPMAATCFIQTETGEPRDGLLKMYCVINSKNEDLKLFRFMQNDESRQAEMRKARAEVKAASAVLSEIGNGRGCVRGKGSEFGGVGVSVHHQDELLQATTTLRVQRKSCLRLAAAERLELRDDLNTLLSLLREGLLECYSSNEHILKLARRLDRISTQPLLWARQRPLLLKRHKEGFFDRWRSAGSPEDPLTLFQKEPSAGHAPSVAGERDEEETEVTDKAVGFSDGQKQFPRKASSPDAETPSAHSASQNHSTREKPISSGRKDAATAPSAAELEELRVKRLLALERKANLARQREAANRKTTP